MRLNNLSARLLMNKWLLDHGHAPISGDKSYVEFATELRRHIAPTCIQAPFVERADACRYIREMASQHGARRAA